MKLVLLLAAGALAAQDTTPPVMTLTLADNKYDRDCASHDCDKKLAAGGNAGGAGIHSATCEIGASLTDCPLPECKAFDHHDVYCKEGEVACANLTGDDLYDFCMLSGAGTAARGIKSECTHEFECDRHVELVDEDGLAVDPSKDSSADPDRSLRAEWLLTFSVSDRTGNPAEPIAFSMVFHDTQPPSLTTEFGSNGAGKIRVKGDTAFSGDIENDNGVYAQHKTFAFFSPMRGDKSDHRKWAESCTEHMVDASSSATDSFAAPASTVRANCVYRLKRDQLVATDNYDTAPDQTDYDVTPWIELHITQPDSTRRPALANTWYTYAQIGAAPALLDIDTALEGKWTFVFRARDNAGIYGWREADNYQYQTVEVTVQDLRAPTLYVQDYAGSVLDSIKIENNSQDPTIECSKAEDYEYADPVPSVLSKDLRESAMASPADTWVFQPVVANEALTTVDVNTLDGTACTQYDEDGTSRCYEQYTLTYDHSDGSETNHAAVQVDRIIRVEDRTPPTISLKDHEGNTVSNDSVLYNSAGLDSKHGSESKHGCKWGATSCVVHGDDGTELTLTGDALKNYCTANPAKCHSTGFFNYDAVGVGTEELAWVTPDAAHAGLGGKSAGWQGASCDDTCDPNPTMVATLHYGTSCADEEMVCNADSQECGQLKNFPEYRQGTYSIKYTCTDGEESDADNGKREQLTHSVCRKLENVDHTKPVIQVLGSQTMVLEATHEGNYVDDGATCYDQVDGVISQNVEVSGDVVNLSKVGTYEIVYHCRDSAGNTAPTVTRTVTVRQTTCPTCQMNNCQAAQVDCTSNEDNRDCTCSLQHEASFEYTDAGATCSDVVDGNLQVDVTNPVNVGATGTYVVTYKATNTQGSTNDDTDCTLDGPQAYMRTVHVVDTLKPVIEIRYKDTLVARSVVSDKTEHDIFGVGKKAHNPMGGWRCKDGAACASMPYGTKAQRAALQEYCAEHPIHCENTVGTHGVLSLMAEGTGSASNAWLLAGVAAAVTGVALLGLSQRRSATSVPV